MPQKTGGGGGRLYSHCIGELVEERIAASIGV